MNPACVFLIVVNILATKVSIETVKCQRCHVSVISRQTSSVKVSFYRVVELVIRRFISTAVSPEDILAALPTEIASQLRSQGAKTINDIFSETGPLDSSLKWYSFGILVTLIHKFGDTKCKEGLREYIESLHTYLQSRVVTPFSATTTTPKNRTIACDQDSNNARGTHDTRTVHDSNSALVVVTDQEGDKNLVDPEGDKDERAYIASLLGTTVNHLQFIPLQAIAT